MTDRPPPYDAEALAALRPRAKALLRKKMRGLRASIPPEAMRLRSAAICARVAALPAWQAARTVAVFVPTEHEVQLGALIAEARTRGITVAVPRVIEGERVMRFGAWFSNSDENPLCRSEFGVMEPPPEAPAVAAAALDLVVVPALVVDASGHRLGYGRAYYDHTLPLATRALRVVVAFDFQLIAEVPAEPHDVAAHVVVTDARTLEVSPGPSLENP